MVYKGLVGAICLFGIASFVSLAVGNILLGMSVLLFFIYTYRHWPLSLSPEKKRYGQVIGIFAILLLFSALFSGHLALGLKTWADFFIWRWMPFLILLYGCQTKEMARKVLGAVGIGLTVDCLYAIYEQITIFGTQVAMGRVAGFVGHPMTLAGWLCILLPILWLFVLVPSFSKKVRIGSFVLFVIAMLTLLFNGTRGAWLSLAIVLPLITIPYVWQNKKVRLKVVSFVLVIGLVLINSSSFLNRVDSIFDTKDWSNASRFIIWEAAYGIFQEHPLLGVGLGSFKAEFKSKFVVSEEMKQEAATYQEYMKNKKNKQLTEEQKKLTPMQVAGLAKVHTEVWQKEQLRGLDHAHNNMVQMAAENGILGLIGYILAFGYIIGYNLRKYKKTGNPYALMIVGGTVALCMQGLTEYNFGNSSVMKMYWLVLGCLVVLSEDEEKNNKIY